jgi:hypothetical protein
MRLNLLLRSAVVSAGGQVGEMQTADRIHPGWRQRQIPHGRTAGGLSFLGAET